MFTKKSLIYINANRKQVLLFWSRQAANSYFDQIVNIFTKFGPFLNVHACFRVLELRDEVINMQIS